MDPRYNTVTSLQGDWLSFPSNHLSAIHEVMRFYHFLSAEINLDLKTFVQKRFLIKKILVKRFFGQKVLVNNNSWSKKLKHRINYEVSMPNYACQTHFRARSAAHNHRNVK